MSRLTPRWRFTFPRSVSKVSAGIPRTVSPNICTKRRNASHAKRGFPVRASSAALVSSLRPRFSTVSIIPGIDAAAPERTETRSGVVGLPSRFPIPSSIAASAASTSSWRPGGYAPPVSSNHAQASVVIVNPGGTGMPMATISASPAPLPPRMPLRAASSMRAASANE